MRSGTELAGVGQKRVSEKEGITMRKARYVLGLALLMAAALYLLPALQASNSPVADSPEVSDLLSQAKNHAVQLRDDADTMKQYGKSKMAWESHVAQINTIRDHVNNLGKVLQKMSDRQEYASPWQQGAIDRVTPLAQELASNIEATIEHINKNQNRLDFPEFQDYLNANFELSSSLSQLIGDYVSYGKSKSTYQRIGSKLEVAGH
jgi:hypothetical protein